MAEDPDKSRRFQFSLRRLFVVIVVAAVGLGLFLPVYRIVAEGVTMTREFESTVWPTIGRKAAAD